jgi:steroid delta-isomerase-like uncharacterized protein
MSNDENESAVRRFMAALSSSGDLDDLNEVCSPEVAQGWRTNMEEFSFTERTFTVTDLVSSGSKVAILWSSTGVHTSPFLGIPATGKDTPSRGSGFFTCDGGRIVDVVSYYDTEAMIAELGATIEPPR